MKLLTRLANSFRVGILLAFLKTPVVFFGFLWVLTGFDIFKKGCDHFDKNLDDNSSRIESLLSNSFFRRGL